MAEIVINKGFISLNGQMYGAGSVLSIVEDNEAKRLVAHSGGDFSFYHDDVPNSGTSEVTENENAVENDVPDSDTEDEGEISEDELPALDPNAAMQTVKNGKGGKGKKK